MYIHTPFTGHDIFKNQYTIQTCSVRRSAILGLAAKGWKVQNHRPPHIQGDWNDHSRLQCREQCKSSNKHELFRKLNRRTVFILLVISPHYEKNTHRGPGRKKTAECWSVLLAGPAYIFHPMRLQNISAVHRARTTQESIIIAKITMVYKYKHSEHYNCQNEKNNYLASKHDMVNWKMS